MRCIKRKNANQLKAKAENLPSIRTHSPSVRVLKNCYSARYRLQGYQIKSREKYVSCLRSRDRNAFTRLKTLGADYTEEAIQGTHRGQTRPRCQSSHAQIAAALALLIDIENSIKAAQSKGYEHWAKIHNLKQAAKTMNFLTENKIEQYADLVSRIEEVADRKRTGGRRIKERGKTACRYGGADEARRHVSKRQKPSMTHTAKQK